MVDAPAVHKDKDDLLAERIHGLVDEKLKEHTGMNREDFSAFRGEVQEVVDCWRTDERTFIANRADSADGTLMPASYRALAQRVLAEDTRGNAAQLGEQFADRAPKYGVPLRGAGLVSCRIFRALAAQSRGFCKDARLLVRKDWNDPGTADLLEAWLDGDGDDTRALASETATDGGILIPEKFLAEIIPLLRAESVMLGLGVRTLPMDNGMSIRIPRHISSVTAQWAQENVEMNASQGSLGYMSLSLRKLSIITAASNELLTMANPLADAFIRQDILETGGLALDDALMRGTGAESEPRGVRYAALAANVTDRSQVGATSTLAEINRDLFQMLEDVEGNNVRLGATAWIMTSREKNVGLMSILDANGNPVFRDEMRQGTLLGHPYKVANQIPKTLGGGDEAEFYFGSWDKYYFAEGSTGSIRSFDGGAYRDSAGNMVSGISADQTVFRVNWFADGDAKHPEAFSIRTAMDWGVL